MHEFSTMQMILETVLNAAKAHGAEKILEINLDIGQLTFLNPEQLRFAFSVLSNGTVAENAKLHIRRVRPRIKCPNCGYQGPIKYDGPEYHLLGVPIPLKCGKCGSAELEIKAGRECSIRGIKVRVPGERRGEA